MELSLARNCMGEAAKTVVFLMGFTTLIGLPVIAYNIASTSKAAATILYILTGLFCLLVRVNTYLGSQISPSILLLLQLCTYLYLFIKMLQSCTNIIKYLICIF